MENLNNKPVDEKVVEPATEAQVNNNKPFFKRKKVRLAILALIGAILAGLACYFGLKKKKASAAETEQPEPEVETTEDATNEQPQRENRRDRFDRRERNNGGNRQNW